MCAEARRGEARHLRHGPHGAAGPDPRKCPRPHGKKIAPIRFSTISSTCRHFLSTHCAQRTRRQRVRSRVGVGGQHRP